MDVLNTLETDFYRLAQGLDSPHLETLKGQLLYQKDNCKLYYYRARQAKESAAPLFIVYALVNRPYILDLDEQHSLLTCLNEDNRDIYILDWGQAMAKHSQMGIDDYFTDYLHPCVQKACQHSGFDTLTMAGICQGGVLALCYSYLYEHHVNALICVSTPIDFHQENDGLSHLIKYVDIHGLVAQFDNIPGHFLTQGFIMLRPFHLLAKKYLSCMARLDDKAYQAFFLAMERWIYDSPDHPGQLFKVFAKDLYQDNQLIKGQFKVADSYIDLRQLKQPVLNLYAENDNLVPAKASLALANHIKPSQYQEKGFATGHIGLYVSKQQAVAASIDDWLNQVAK